MHVFFKRQILGCGQCHTGSRDTFHGRVVCQVDKEDGTVDGTGFLKTLHEEVGLLEGNTHGCEYHGETLVFSADLRLPCDLRRQLRMGQTGHGEDRKLLTADQGVQSVDGGHPGLNKLVGVTSGCRVHGQAVDIHSLVRKDLGASVDGASHTVEDASQHILGCAQLHASSQETYFTVGEVDTGGTLIKLYHSVASVYLQHLAPADLAVCQLDLAQLVVGNAFHALYQHQRSGYFLYGSILFRHLEVLLSACVLDLGCQFFQNLVILCIQIVL